MSGYANFETKNKKNERDRYDIYESEFETPLKSSDYNSTIISRNINELSEACSFLRWMPDIFWDLYKPEVRNFLISSALFWLEKFHFDGIRVDAVAAMLYLNFGGKHLYNEDGSTHNREAIEFIKEFNSVVHLFHSDCITIAEESSDWPGITESVDKDGLGFDFKWNMGWMNDTLRYIEIDPINRKNHHNLLTFSLVYAFNERYVLPFSHDEVVHLKKSMIEKISD